MVTTSKLAKVPLYPRYRACGLKDAFRNKTPNLTTKLGELSLLTRLYFKLKTAEITSKGPDAILAWLERDVAQRGDYQRGKELSKIFAQVGKPQKVLEWVNWSLCCGPNVEILWSRKLFWIDRMISLKMLPQPKLASLPEEEKQK